MSQNKHWSTENLVLSLREWLDLKKKKKKKHIHTTGCNTTLKTNEAELHTLTKKNVHDYKVIKTSCRITDVA